MMLIPEELLEDFESAGWKPGRSIALPPPVTAQIPDLHPSLQILSSLSGITVGKCGGGQQCTTSDVTFGFVERGDEADVWSGLLNTTLIGIAVVHHAHGELYVDSTGRFFETSAMSDTACYRGDSFSAAVHGLLRGIACRPMLRPDQESVTLYGHEFTISSPEVYNYSRLV